MNRKWITKVLSLLIASLMSLLISSCVPVSTGTVDGQVTTNSGDTISDIRVLLLKETALSESDYPKADGPETKTDSNGKYKIEKIEPGKYIVAIEVSANSEMKCLIVTPPAIVT